MPAVKTRAKNDFQKKLHAVLADGLKEAGIRSTTIRMERIPQTRLTRVLVTSPTFKQLRHSERQDLVWRIIGQHFTPDEQLHISMVMALAPREVNAA
jgi:hypothetical protein